MNKPPGHPIVASNECLLEPISEYVDCILRPLVEHLPSYLKDTGDFMMQLSGINIEVVESNNIFFTTMDVVSLYTFS